MNAQSGVAEPLKMRSPILILVPLKKGLESIESIMAAYYASKEKAREGTAGSSGDPAPEPTCQKWKCVVCKAVFEATDDYVPYCFHCGAPVSFELEHITLLQRLIDGLEVLLNPKNYELTPKWWPTEDETWVGLQFVRIFVKAVDNACKNRYEMP